MSLTRFVAYSDDLDYRAAIEDGVRSIATIVVPETGRVLVGLAELSQYRAVGDEAARAAS